ncbi:uncharacterized protein KGF55_002636 [Candida pseudojiufengensis]|uniref:uncharacterized protein n=1 Tax=Candida pseudojiufengensis TaxID=497109 RepID=UPI002225209D|nr:uncharacterized protein KGF55_002636 [Candida pseudojiufengensis]KAI5963756.1 hypothetical protein KGF55_002636 [Candida pseudojiufengensis]
MTLPGVVAGLLPQKFFGYIPLAIGVEIILGITILNKAGGLYGILSLFTGHPINFWQWLYNSLALIMLPIYANALINLTNKQNNVRKISLSTVVYLIDTLIGILYTLYFMVFWFYSEEESGTDVGGNGLNFFKRTMDETDAGADLSKQSASAHRELFFIFSTSLIMTVIRIYFTLVLISFNKNLLKQQTLRDYNNHNETNSSSQNNQVDAEEQEILDSKGIYGEFRKVVLDIEIRAKEFLSDYLL